jgi:signal transduction histidine kinase
MRTFFLGLASHDLKTPLAVVSNYLQTILDGFVGEVNHKQRRWMESANRRVLELIRLIDDFVDVSQLAPDRIATEMRSIALRTAVENSIREIQHQIDEKSILLRIDIPSHLPPVCASPHRLQRVLTNLLVNAVTCSPRRGEVCLSVNHREQTVRVDVVDAGPGIPRRYLPDVFQDYLQVQRAEFVPGAGLGLSTARKVIEAHGGTIWVESPCFDDGQGCRFVFTLPCDIQRDDSPRE